MRFLDKIAKKYEIYAMGRPYKMNLTKEEYDSLAYIADRYTYAQVLFDALQEESEGNYSLSEPEAWAFKDAVEEEDGYLTLAGSGLKRKIETLLNKIV